jgi:hypothetical protein
LVFDPNIDGLFGDDLSVHWHIWLARCNRPVSYCLPSDRAFLEFRIGTGISANANQDGNTRSGGADDKSSALTNEAVEAAWVLFSISIIAQD